MTSCDEIDPAWKNHETYSVDNIASLMAGIDPNNVVFDPQTERFRYAESVTANTNDINRVSAYFKKLKSAIEDKKLEASIIHSARLCEKDGDKPSKDEGIIFKYEWFDNDNNDIGRQDIIYSALPDWSKTKVRRDHLITWLKDIEYNDMFFNPKSDISADTYKFMNPDHRRYNPLLAAAVTVWEAFEAEDVRNEYRNKNSRISIETWLADNAGKIPELFRKLGVASKISKNAAEKISEITNWNKPGTPKKDSDE